MKDLEIPRYLRGLPPLYPDQPQKRSGIDVFGIIVHLAYSTVLIAGFDDIPSHQFLVEEVFEDCITGTALTGPLAGEYGEPDIALVLQVLTRPT